MIIIQYKILCMQHVELEKRKIILNALAEVVKKLRNKTEKSQRMLAFEYGLHKSLINRMENSLSEPKLFSILKIAQIFGIKPSKFLQLLEKELPEGFTILEE